MAALRIGLTGGIASGKTAVASAFARRGVPVIDADRIARDVVAPGTAALAAVLAEFGPGLVLPDGGLDRRRLRDIVFADPERRRRLEAILHPPIRRAIEAEAAAVTAPYAVIAIPLLAETGQRASVDRVLVVDCPAELQKARLMARDGETAERAAAMLTAQAPRDARLAIADDRIDNTGSLEDLDRSVDTLHQRYLSLSGDRRVRGC
ncbi:MAG TPA: dephospho-CoA kinase [Steroidobacteraceae bacterium]|nr:dephospho-CoA kinase [Steroidobacteraceae bacterium]